MLNRIIALSGAFCLSIAAPAYAKCSVWNMPTVIINGASAPMCVKHGRNISAMPHSESDCEAPTANITCSSEQEFNEYQAAHPDLKLNPGQ